MFARWMAILAGVAAALVLAGCRAPMWVGGNPYEPQITRPMAESMADALGVQAEERTAFLDLHAAYFDEHSRAAARLRDYIASVAALEDEPDGIDLAAKRVTAFTRYASHVDALADRFLADARLMLDAAALARWPDAERALRRAQFLSADGGHGGVDLTLVVLQMKLPEATAASVEPVLADYRAAIDPALMRQAAFIRSNLRRNLQASETENTAEHQALYREWVGLQREERSVNRRFSKTIQDLLPDDRRAEFRARVHRGMHQIFRSRTPVDEAKSHLDTLTSASDETRTQVAQIFAERERRRDELCDRVAARIDVWEEHATLDELVEGAGAPDEVAGVGEELERIDRDSIRRLSTQLSAEQMRALGLVAIRRDLPDLDFTSGGTPE